MVLTQRCSLRPAIVKISNNLEKSNANKSISFDNRKMVLGQLPPRKNVPTLIVNPNPKLDPKQRAIFLGSNCLDTQENDIMKK